jgi:AbrB family transcriptional regulator (stage V sporulation protein T)
LKTTGIVRRIDDLGRIVIPKEIRRTLHIRDGDSLEIFTDREGSVVFKKYSPVRELSPFAGQYSEVLSRAASLPILICDRDCVVAVSGLSYDDYIDRKVNSSLDNAMQNCNNFFLQQSDAPSFQTVEGIESKALAVAPISLSGSEAVGCVVAIAQEANSVINETQVHLINMVAEILARQIKG